MSKVIQFPVQHGPITELEHAKRGVQQAAMNVFGRPVNPERAQRMAELIIQRKRKVEAGLIPSKSR